VEKTGHDPQEGDRISDTDSLEQALQMSLGSAGGGDMPQPPTTATPLGKPLQAREAGGVVANCDAAAPADGCDDDESLAQAIAMSMMEDE